MLFAVSVNKFHLLYTDLTDFLHNKTLNIAPNCCYKQALSHEKQLLESFSSKHIKSFNLFHHAEQL